MRVLFPKFSYQKLNQQVIFQDHEQYDHRKHPNFDVIRSSFSLRRTRFTRIRPRRFRLRIAGFRKLFRMKRVKVGRLSWAKFVKRIKESQSHFGDLFSGNYLFMQVSPTSLKNNRPYLAHHNHHLNYHVNNDKFHAFSPSKFNNYALQKVA
ncbi:hypothetical protein RND81_08G142900 [Saponaria officinalis]|uniref:Uncharacterized protein n=1 Tax=Saponaria officinalis TaxID=3572 RepID=A0AAW1J868_SAPOF